MLNQRRRFTFFGLTVAFQPLNTLIAACKQTSSKRTVVVNIAQISPHELISLVAR